MSNFDATERFFTKCAEATLGYAHASFLAGVHFTDAAMGQWEKTCAELTGQSATSPKSWFRHPDHDGALTPFNTPATSWYAMAMSPAAMTQPMVSPSWFDVPSMMSLWSGFMPKQPAAFPSATTLFPFSTAATAWPMTWALMGMGLPHEVAKPTAEANVAAYDAFESANQVVNESVEACQAAFDAAPIFDAPKSSSDPDDPLALFRCWFQEPCAA